MSRFYKKILFVSGFSCISGYFRTFIDFNAAFTLFLLMKISIQHSFVIIQHSHTHTFSDHATSFDQTIDCL